MKVGIFTLPFHSNYGGILQAWALQETLRRLGHEPIFLRQPGFQAPWLLQPFAIMRRTMLRIQGRSVPLLARIHDARLEQRIASFPLLHLSQSPVLPDAERRERFVREMGIRAVIAGSDQIWRPQHTSAAYFLDFLDNMPDVRRIAYAVSFGTDTVDFGRNLTNYSALAKRFNAISVREDGAIPVVERLFGISPNQTLDPTMLVPTSEYRRIAVKTNEDRIAAYFLSGAIAHAPLLEQLQNRLRTPIAVLPTAADCIDQLLPAPMPSVEEWLGTMIQVQSLVTDSFHGTVFAILFGKSFVSFDNGSGAGRIRSLLSLFNLNERLLSFDAPIDSVYRLLAKPLQTEEIGNQLQLLVNSSRKFLEQALI
jgi:hypothetical protein